MVTLRGPRLLWTLSLVLPVLAGAVAAVIETTERHRNLCPAGSGGGVTWDVVYIALALVPGVVVGLLSWRERDQAEDGVAAVLPFCLSMCLSVFLVFIGIAAAWGGHGCMI